MFEEIIKRIQKRRAKGKNLELPPILDEDPVLATKYLSLADSSHFINVLIQTYNNLGEDNQVNIALEELMLHSKVNYEWFRSFTLALNQLENEGREIYIPSEDIANLRTDDTQLVFVPPLEYKYQKVSPIRIHAKDNNVITLNRVLYIREGYSKADFRKGYPSWYSLSEVTIFERYNPKTNKRVRIDFKNGEFKYYMAGASDCWIEIVDVPLEMDHVVSALLFR